MSGQKTLYDEAAREWVEQHTAYRFNGGEPPASVRLFIEKFAELMQNPQLGGVRLEKIGGLKQTFEPSGEVAPLIETLAQQLLGKWYRGARFIEV